MTRKKITPDEPERRTIYGPSGGQKGQKLQRYDLIPIAPLEEVAKVYGTGASKYAERNWERGYEWSKSYASLSRHLNAFWDGESIDNGTEDEPGTNRHHLANVIFHAMALMEFELKDSGLDDRPGTTEHGVYDDLAEWLDGPLPAASSPLTEDDITLIEGTDTQRAHLRRVMERFSQ